MLPVSGFFHTKLSTTIPYRYYRKKTLDKAREKTLLSRFTTITFRKQQLTNMNLLNFVSLSGNRKQTTGVDTERSRKLQLNDVSSSSIRREDSELSASPMTCKPKKRRLAVAEGHPLLCYKYSCVK